MPKPPGSSAPTPAASDGRRSLATGARHDPEEVDERGDAVFRFALPPSGTPVDLTEVYRSMLQDLAGLVVLYSRGQRVVVDAFAFAHEPDQVVDILPRPPAERGDAGAP